MGMNMGALSLDRRTSLMQKVATRVISAAPRCVEVLAHLALDARRPLLWSNAAGGALTCCRHLGKKRHVFLVGSRSRVALNPCVVPRESSFWRQGEHEQIRPYHQPCDAILVRACELGPVAKRRSREEKVCAIKAERVIQATNGCKGLA